MAGCRGSRGKSRDTAGEWVTDLERIVLEITGIVQGVGFRPFVYRVARELGLTGWVRNSPSGVTVEAQGDAVSLDRLASALAHEPPPLAVIGSIRREVLSPVCGESGFTILSSGEGAATAEVPPDMDLCDDCLREMFDPADRRYRYPFITCTNCGPRYSIITALPYDRPFTTMCGFPLCDACRAEYGDPADRRFHAQPVACPACGPRVRLLHPDGSEAASRGEPSLQAAVRMLRAGKIVAVKGGGGYHLAVDACNVHAVRELRLRKNRPAKPFAVMVRDISAATEAASVEPLEERLLTGPERPIVLVRKRVPASGVCGIVDEVAPDSDYLGVMLPSTPLHHLLLHDFGGPLVMTSGNRSSEPVAYDDAEALKNLAGIADAFLVHDRPIRTRVDDSVIRTFRGNPLFIRRSRGYAPRAVQLADEFPSVLAVGAELKGACCLTRGNLAFMSQHIGDMANMETVDALADTAAHLGSLLGVTPVAIAHDLHPDYLSTRFAVEESGLPALAVHHHHAHLAACMAENRLQGPVIGVIFDGTGYGPDHTIWGGEFLIGGYDEYRRAGRFLPVPLPGGDAAVREPFRMALSWCHEALGPAAFDLSLPGWDRLDGEQRRLLRFLLERGMNSPLTSSCGRLFDAAAALLGVRGTVSYEGQAAIELEALAEGSDDPGFYPFSLSIGGDIHEIDWRPLFVALIDDLRAGVPQTVQARRFHRSVAAASVELCCRLRDETRLERVVLSGGVFQNRLLTEMLSALLEAAGFRVYQHRLAPPNDGGLALGQAVIAGSIISKRRG